MSSADVNYGAGGHTAENLESDSALFGFGISDTAKGRLDAVTATFAGISETTI